MLAFAALMSSCSGDSISELYFVGDSLVAGWDVKSSFPTYLTHNDGVIGAKVEDILTWNLDYRGKDVVMLVGTNNLSTAIIIMGIAVILVFTASPKYLQFIAMGALGAGFLAVFLSVESDVYDYFLYEGAMNMDYSLDGLHLNNLGYNILNVRLSKVL